MSTGVSWGRQGDWHVVLQVTPRARAAGLQPGDRLLSINGHAEAQRFGPRLPDGERSDVWRLEVARNGSVLQFDLVPQPAIPRLTSIWGLLALALSAGAMGAVLGLAKPDMLTARLGLAAGLLGGCTFLSQSATRMDHLFVGAERWVALLSSATYPFYLPIAFHYLSAFPQPVRESLPWRLARYAMYLMAFGVWLPRTLTKLQYFGKLNFDRTSVVPAALLEPWDAAEPTMRFMIHAVCGLAMILALVRNYRGLRSEMDRRRVRWAAMGALPAAMSLVGLTALSAVIRLAGRAELIESGALAWLQDANAFFVVPAPIALAYAIVKHRVMGIRLVLRRSLQYLLAQNALRVILLAPLLAIVIELIRQPNRGIGDLLRDTPLALELSMLGFVVLAMRYRQSIQNWIDRRFFRTYYSQERILLELVEELQAVDSIEEISTRVAHKIEAALQPKELLVFYRRDATSGFTVGYPNELRGGSVLRLLKEQELLSAFEQGRPTPLYVTDPNAVDEQGEAAPASLAIPLRAADQRLAGLLWLGEKRSEEPYSERDKDLLQTIASQVAVVYENLLLKERLAEERRVRAEVMSRLDERAINILKECPRCGLCFDRTIEHCSVDGEELTMTLPVDRVIDKKYRLDQRLAVGGMGAVYEAVDLRLGRKTAVKIMMGRLFGNRTALRRFEREAHAAARLRHPGIVTIHDFGRLEGEGAYLVMERLEGHSWRVEMSARKMVKPRHAARWFDQLLLAVAHAHTAGVVHRDLKPENLMLVPGRTGDEPQVVVLDFGVAKMREIELTENHASSITATGVVMGTLRYMSPEQLAGREADSRSDIYSIAVIVVECLFGGLPTKMRDLQTWVNRRLPQGSELARILDRALEADPAARYATADEFRRELVPALRTCPKIEPAADSLAIAVAGPTKTVEL